MFFEKRVGGLFLLMFLVGGCATAPSFERSRPVQLAPLEVIAWRPYAAYAYRPLCVLPFHMPQGMESAGVSLARIFRQTLAREGVFTASRMVEDGVSGFGPGSEGQRLCTESGLVLVGTVDQIHDGSGALPTVLEMTVRLFDSREGSQLWEVIQRGRSFPSPDLDLFWNVLPGGGAADYRVIARDMARQLAVFLKGSDTDVASERGATCVAGGYGYGREDR